MHCPPRAWASPDCKSRAGCCNDYETIYVSTSARNLEEERGEEDVKLPSRCAYRYRNQILRKLSVPQSMLQVHLQTIYIYCTGDSTILQIKIIIITSTADELAQTYQKNAIKETAVFKLKSIRLIQLNVAVHITGRSPVADERGSPRRCVATPRIPFCYSSRYAHFAV